MLNGLVLAFSIACGVASNAIKNQFSKGALQTLRDNVYFNLLMSFACVLVMAVAGGCRSASMFTILLAAVFGLINVLAGILSVQAMRHGPMTLSVLINHCGGLISALAGPVIWKESITVFQIFGILLMLISMALVLNPTLDSKITVKWAMLALGTFFLNGFIGVVQKIQTNSSYSVEKMQFLFWAFTFSCLFLVAFLLFSMRTGRAKPTCSFRGKVGVSAILVGLGNAAQHIINLILVGAIPSAIFFPICGGANILLTALLGAVIFRERMTKRQTVGFVCGVIAILLVANVASLFF